MSVPDSSVMSKSAHFFLRVNSKTAFDDAEDAWGLAVDLLLATMAFDAVVESPRRWRRPPMGMGAVSTSAMARRREGGRAGGDQDDEEGGRK